MESQQASATNPANGNTAETANLDQRPQQRRMNTKKELVPPSGADGCRGAPPVPATSASHHQLNSFTFSMPTGHDDQSVASTITMSTIKTDRSESVDVFDFQGENLVDDEVDPIEYEHASQSTPDAGCFHFEKAMDTVFVKIYEIFVDEDAMMFACQDEPTEATPILDYETERRPGIPAVISMTEEVGFDQGSSKSPKDPDGQENVCPSKDVKLSLPPSPSRKEASSTTDVEARNGTPSQSSRDLNDIVGSNITKKSDKVEESSPWRLDSLLYPRDRKDESIEVGEAGEVVFEDTITFNKGFHFPARKTGKSPSRRTPPPVAKTGHSDLPTPFEKQGTASSENDLPSLKQESILSFESNTTKSSSSKKRSLGLRYLFSPKLRKLNVLPWKRRSPKKYQNMQKFDDPSYSPETVTTTAPSTLHSDGLSFQCDMSLKTSSVMSLKTTSVLMKQDLHHGSPPGNDSSSLSYAYPQSMVA